MDIENEERVSVLISNGSPCMACENMQELKEFLTTNIMTPKEKAKNKMIGLIDELLSNSENVKQDTKPDTRSELYTDDRDSMQAEQAVNADTEGFGGEPIEDNIHSGKGCQHPQHRRHYFMKPDMSIYLCKDCRQTHLEE